MLVVVKSWRALRSGGRVALALGVAQAAENFPNPRYTGLMAIREWSQEEVRGATQCFSITQAKETGLIYVGGSDGVLEYDGVRWRKLPLLTDRPNQATRGLVVDRHGRIWAGFDNELLRYTPDDRGGWRVESMLSLLPESQRAVGTVWQLHEASGAIWGTARKCVLRFALDRDVTRLWATPQDWQILGVTDDKVWFRLPDGALGWGYADTVEPAQVPVAPPGVVALAVYRDSAGGLRLDHTRGVLELAEGGWRETAPDLGRLLQGEGAASRARRLPDGRGVFSTRTRFLIFVTANGEVLGRLAEPPGVTFGVTPQTYVDRDGGLWMANANGIRRVQVDGVVARHDRALGLRGDVRDLEQQGATIFAATAQGLFARVPQTGKFELRSRSLSDLFRLAPGPAGGWLIAAGANFREWTAQEDVALPGIPPSGVAVACDPRDPARVFVSSTNSLGVYRRRDTDWREEAQLGGINATAYSLAVSDRGTLWVAGGLVPGLWHAAAPAGDWSKAKFSAVSAPDHPGVEMWQVSRWHGDVVVYGPRGAFVGDDATGRLVEDARFAGLPQGTATPIATMAVGAKTGAVYVAGGGTMAGRYWRGVRPTGSSAWQWVELPLQEAFGQITPAAMLESAEGDTLWLGGLKSIVSLDLRAPPPPPYPAPAARWRRIKALESSEVYFGGADARKRLDLPLGRRAVEIEFSAPTYRTHLGGETGIEFRTRAAGVDTDWTGWSRTGGRELTNLPHGAVRLEVQARNHLRQEGPVATLELRVPPFWWETWWFLALGVLASIALVTAAVRWLVRRQFQLRIAVLEAQAAVQNERLRIARDMHDDLGSTLASIVHLSSGAAGTEANAAGYLARIHEAARDLVHRTRDIVWAATPQHDSLESLCEQLATHAERVLGDRGVEVRVELPATIPEVPIQAAARHGLFLAFKESVNNAAKYAQAFTAIVRVELQTGSLVVTLTDDGVGFAPGKKQGTGNGLGNLRTRMAELGGSAEITSVVGRGTTVTLRMPCPAAAS